MSVSMWVFLEMTFAEAQVKKVPLRDNHCNLEIHPEKDDKCRI